MSMLETPFEAMPEDDDEDEVPEEERPWHPEFFKDLPDTEVSADQGDVSSDPKVVLPVVIVSRCSPWPFYDLSHCVLG
jgi:hypothetical protein